MRSFAPTRNASIFSAENSLRSPCRLSKMSWSGESPFSLASCCKASWLSLSSARTLLKFTLLFESSFSRFFASRSASRAAFSASLFPSAISSVRTLYRSAHFVISRDSDLPQIAGQSVLEENSIQEDCSLSCSRGVARLVMEIRVEQINGSDQTEIVTLGFRRQPSFKISI